LTGILAGGRPIEVSPMIRITEVGIEAALGWYPGSTGVPHGALIERLRVESHRTATGGVQLTRRAVRQFARTMILMLIQECFVARGGDEVGLFWLVLLRDFSIIHTWDWSGLILSVLYDSMDSFSRLVSSCHRGLSMLWEVCHFFPPTLPLFVPSCFACLIDTYLFLLQSWFMAYAGRDRILYREDTPYQFPLYHRFH